MDEFVILTYGPQDRLLLALLAYKYVSDPFDTELSDDRTVSRLSSLNVEPSISVPVLTSLTVDEARGKRLIVLGASEEIDPAIAAAAASVEYALRSDIPGFELYPTPARS